MNLSLKGKTAIVCGSSQGIGLATAIELSLLGASCILLARNEEKLKTAAAQLDTSVGQFHAWFSLDFTNLEDTKTLIEKIAADQHIHILVNNSGGPASGPITQATTDQFLTAFQQHLVVNHILTTAVLDGMKSEQYGRIINIISTSVKTPLKNLGVSNTTRGAVASWAKTMANELGVFNITVNNVLPGSTTTERLDSIIDANASKSGRPRSEIEKDMMEEVPMKRFADPSEVAAVAAFLASPAASYVNGVSIPVDGGRTGSI